MIKILIVDDEKPAIKAIETLLIKLEISKENIYSAFGIQEAQSILSTQEIQIMFCDIEMPGGSGLDLLKWIEEKSFPVKSIITSCHDNFQYAKEGLKYGIIDYLLKPVMIDELSAVLKKSLDFIDAEVWHQRKKFDEKNTEIILHKEFWNEVASGNHRSFDKILESARKKNIKLQKEDMVLPIVVFFEKMGKTYRDIKNSLGYFIFENMMREIISYDNEEVILLGGEDNYVIICPENQKIKIERGDLYNRCEKFVQILKEHMDSSISCYIGRKRSPQYLHEELVMIYEYHSKDIFSFERTLIFRGNMIKEGEYKPFEKEYWKSLFVQKNKFKLKKEIEYYFEEQEKNEEFGLKALKDFEIDFIHMINIILLDFGIDAKLLVQDGKNLLDIAPEKLVLLKIWCRDIIENIFLIYEKNEEEQDVVEKIRYYIKVNREKKISRENIAELIGFNPEYLSRFFKKETGILLSDFIVNEKIEYAAELLEKTDVGISDIALQLGYDNFSNFARAFKKCKGISPSNYRKEKSHLLNNKKSLNE